MTHAEAQELLLDLVYGELEAERALEVERHAEACAECTRERAQLAGARRMVAPLAELEEPPAGFDDRILAAARAEASLRADGTPGAVIEVTGSVRPAGIEAAMVDPHAPVRTVRRAARPRRALRWVIGGSAAAAAALTLAVSSSRSKHDEPAAESAAYEIHIKAPQQQPELATAPSAAPETGGPHAAAHGAAAPLAPGAGALAAAPPPPLPAAEAEHQAQSAERARQPASQQQATRELGGGGDVSNRLAEAPAEKPAGQAAPRRGVADEPAPASPVVVAGARAKKAPRDASPTATAAPGADAAAAAEARAAASPAVMEDAARKSRREGNYALAAAQYRKAAQLRRDGSDASAPAWDLAHAVECLSAISQWDEARRVRRDLLQLYPAEQSAASAAARALRPAELAPSSSDSIDPGK